MPETPLPEPDGAPAASESAPNGTAPAGRARREPAFNLPSVVTAFIAACVGVHLVRAQFLDMPQDLELILRAAFIPIRYTGGYDLDIWALVSPLSYSFLHGNLVHLAINMVWLAAFGAPLAGRLGAARFALFWAVTAVAGAGFFMLFHAHGEAPLVGASGAISGMMGAAARFGFCIDRRHRLARFMGPPLAIPEVLRLRGVLVFLGVWLVVNLATGFLGAGPGFEGQVAWEAHIGGFLAGFFGLPLMLGAARRESRQEG